jgi:hypothetical protein
VVDVEARQMEAALTVELMHEQQKDEERAKDLVYLLAGPRRRWLRFR